MKTSKISQLLIVFYFITLTGCIECDDNGNGCLSIEGSIISSNARAPGYFGKYFILFAAHRASCLLFGIRCDG